MVCAFASFMTLVNVSALLDQAVMVQSRVIPVNQLWLCTWHIHSLLNHTSDNVCPFMARMNGAKLAKLGYGVKVCCMLMPNEHLLIVLLPHVMNWIDVITHTQARTHAHTILKQPQVNQCLQTLQTDFDGLTRRPVSSSVEKQVSVDEN